MKHRNIDKTEEIDVEEKKIVQKLKQFLKKKQKQINLIQ